MSWGGVRLVVEQVLQPALGGAKCSLDLEQLGPKGILIGRAEPVGDLGDAPDQLVQTAGR